MKNKKLPYVCSYCGKTYWMDVVGETKIHKLVGYCSEACERNMGEKEQEVIHMR